MHERTNFAVGCKYRAPWKVSARRTRNGCGSLSVRYTAPCGSSPSAVDCQPSVQRWQTEYPRLRRAHIVPIDLAAGCEGQLGAFVDKRRPDLVALFTGAGRGWFERLFADSRSEAFSFVTKTPMLVLRKNRL